jgi:fumarate reductase flavoprotein subunit
MISNQDFEIQNKQFDIVVVGGGGTGLAAAVAAAEMGAQVVVLEKGNAPGGNSARAVGFFAADSPTQKRMRIDAPRDVLFKMAMDYTHWKINPLIMRAFIDKSGDTVRWLEEKGLVIDRIPSFVPNQLIRTEHDAVKGGSDVVKLLLKNCEELGVPVLRLTAARKIIMNAGKIAGVLAACKGQEFQIAAGSVIIASGGYAANQELLKKYSPWYTEDIRYHGLPHTGDGLIMALETGAATEGLGQIRMIGPIFDGSRKRVGILYNQPDVIWVNKKGLRYIDEAMAFNHFESVNAVLQQPGKVSFSLFDEQYKLNIMKEGPIKVAQEGFYGHFGTDLSDLPQEFEKEEAEGTSKKADSWDEIAKWIGADPGALRDTVEEYNSGCDCGHDRLMAKDRRYLKPVRTPPFYVMRGHVTITTTQGGIKIDHQMQVLNQQDDPIPGLYAGGDVTGGWESETYNVNLSGSGLGFALNSGRIAGENAVRYLKSARSLP